MNNPKLERQRDGKLNGFLNEVIIVGRFGIVGLIATAVHLVVVWILIEVTTLPTLIANTFAFITAFVVSFSGHYLWTFSNQGRMSEALIKFLLISLSGFSANSFILAGLLHVEWFSPSMSSTLAVAAVPVITFFSSRLWGFKTW